MVSNADEHQAYCAKYIGELYTARISKQATHYGWFTDGGSTEVLKAKDEIMTHGLHVLSAMW